MHNYKHYESNANPTPVFLSTSNPVGKIRATNQKCICRLGNYHLSNVDGVSVL